jgi:WhiB family redox-sensing transcriptional regulator
MTNPIGSLSGRLQGFGALADWELDAACYGTPLEIWFGSDWDDDDGRPKHSVRRTQLQTRLAAAICRTCPVLDNCREWVLEVNLPYGFVAGMTESDRRQERLRRGLVNGSGRIPGSITNERRHTSVATGVRDGSLRLLPGRLPL